MKNPMKLMQDRLNALDNMLQGKPNMIFIQSQEEEKEEDEEEIKKRHLMELAMAAAKAEGRPKAARKKAAAPTKKAVAPTKRTPVVANSKLGKELNPRTTR